MVPSIARQSVIIKCNLQTSVLLGNYEMYYLAGLLKNLYKLPLDAGMKPKEIMDVIHANEELLVANGKQEEYMISIIKPFLPLEDYDEQMQELFEWGANEQDFWKMTTGR